MRALLPTGRTPRGLYAALRAHAADGSLPSEHVTVLGLDEYLGPRADDPRSARAALDRKLAEIPIGRREALDGAASDPDAEAVRYQALLDTAIDVAVLGLGRDAHVAFNEPGSAAGAGVHRVASHPWTITTWRSCSATASRASAPSTASPPTRAHGWPAPYVCVAPPHAHGGAHRLHPHRRAVRGRADAARVAAGRRSPCCLLEVAGRNTAENASRSLRIVLALGVATRVSVVTSTWHLRAPYFFAPCRDFAMQLGMTPSRPLRGSGRLLAEELGALPSMVRQPRAAMQAVRLPDGP